MFGIVAVRIYGEWHEAVDDLLENYFCDLVVGW